MKINSHLPVRPQAQDVDQKLKDAAKMYERHFLNEMVKAMRGTVQHTEEPSMANRIFTDKVFDQYTEDWSDNGGIGLANLIYHQIKERFSIGKGEGPVNLHQGPIELKKGTTIKIDETKPLGIPVLPSAMASDKDLSYLFEWESGPNAPTEIVNPWDGKVLQAFRTEEDRQVLKIGHDNGLMSTLSYIGRAKDYSPGMELSAGTSLGLLSPDTRALSWQIVQTSVKS